MESRRRNPKCSKGVEARMPDVQQHRRPDPSSLSLTHFFDEATRLCKIEVKNDNQNLQNNFGNLHLHIVIILSILLFNGIVNRYFDDRYMQIIGDCTEDAKNFEARIKILLSHFKKQKEKRKIVEFKSKN